MSKETFIQGFKDAKAGTVYDPTPRQVEAAYPEYTREEVDAYINGVMDGVDGDTFRLRLRYCTHPDAAWCDCEWRRWCRSNGA